MTSESIADLVQLYFDLPIPSGNAPSYSAKIIPNHFACRVAKDDEGNPALLVSVGTKRIGTGTSTPFQLRYLSFEPESLCRITSSDGKSDEELLAVVKCTTNDSVLREFFLRSLSGSVSALTPSPGQDEIANLVNTLIEVFRALELPPESAIEGVWGELFLILESHNANVAASAWHAVPHDIHDFVDGANHIEVKSTLGSLRIHNFTLRQLEVPKGANVVVASMMLSESDSGWSIRDLWDQICRREDLKQSLRNRLSRILMASLGRDWVESRRVRFDPESARKELRVYSAEAIPAVRYQIPVEVTDVRFRSELTNVAPLALSALRSCGGLLEAVFG